MRICDGPRTTPVGSLCRAWCTDIACLSNVSEWAHKHTVNSLDTNDQVVRTLKVPRHIRSE